MQARSALVAAIVCGALAVGVVTADVAWSLQVNVQASENGVWRTVAGAPEYPISYDGHPRGPSCPGPELRLIVDNDRPIGADAEVLVTFYNQSSGRTDTLLRERLALSPFTSETFDLSVPDAAFPAGNASDTREGPLLKEAGLQVRFGDIDLWVSVCQEEAT